MISFAKYFKFVNAVEYSRQRARLLQHNINAAGVGDKVRMLRWPAVLPMACAVLGRRVCWLRACVCAYL